MFCSGDNDADDSEGKLLRNLVRQEMMSQGLPVLESSDGMKAIPYLQVSRDARTRPSWIYVFVHFYLQESKNCMNLWEKFSCKGIVMVITVTSILSLLLSLALILFIITIVMLLLLLFLKFQSR